MEAQKYLSYSYRSFNGLYGLYGLLEKKSLCNHINFIVA